jgi:hypothetical protein
MTGSLEQGQRSPYFVNAWVDSAMIGGLAIAGFAVARLWLSDDAGPAALQAALIASVFVNYPHFSATVYRLYQSPANIRQFPVTALGVPLMLVGVVAAAMWQPQWVAPYLITLFLVWSAYHYSGQTIGITLLYGRRAGFVVGGWQRLALSAFVYSTFVATFADPRNSEPDTRYGVVVPAIHFPGWFYPTLMTVMLAGAIGFAWFLVAGWRASRRAPPLIVLLPAVTQFVWFLPGRHTAGFFPFIALFHGLQYLYIAWAMQMGLRLGRPIASRPAASIAWETFRWGWRIYVGGIVLFVAVPWLPFWVDLPAGTAAGIVVAAINIHHFFVDGVIWKLRDTAIVSPLMLEARDWGLPPSAMQPAPAPS